MDDSENLEKQPNHILASLQNDLETRVFNRKNTQTKGNADLIEQGDKKLADEINRGLETRDRLVDVDKDLGYTKNEAFEMEANANDLKRIAGRHYKVVGYVLLVLSIIFAVGGIVYVILTTMNRNTPHQQLFYKKFVYHDENISKEADGVKDYTTKKLPSSNRLLTDNIHKQQLQSNTSSSESIKGPLIADNSNTVAKPMSIGLAVGQKTEQLDWKATNNPKDLESSLKEGVVDNLRQPLRLV